MSVQHTVLSEAFADLAIGGEKRELFDAISQAFAVLSTEAPSSVAVLDDLTDVNTPAPNNNEVLTWNAATSKWISQAVAGSGVATFNGRAGAVVPVQADYDGFFLTPAEGNAAYSLLGHTHPASDIASGTFADARISQSSVTQHQAALALAATQLTSGVLADARVQQSNVTQHQAALALAGTQITSGLIAAARLGSGGTGTNFLRSDQTWQAPTAVVAITPITVNVAVPVFEKVFTVIDAGVSSGSDIMVRWGACLDTDVNHPSMVGLEFDVVPAAGQFLLKLYSTDGSPLFGDFKLIYLVG